MFLVRAENSHGLSVPSGLSNVARTLGNELGVVPQAELAAARSVLSGKVSVKKILYLKTISIATRRHDNVCSCRSNHYSREVCEVVP